MSRPHSHPAHRRQGTLSKAEYEAEQRRKEIEALERDAKASDECRQRSDRWIKELE